MRAQSRSGLITDKKTLLYLAKKFVPVLVCVFLKNKVWYVLLRNIWNSHNTANEDKTINIVSADFSEIYLDLLGGKLYGLPSQKTNLPVL
jgi:hypothetical protein